MTRSGILACLAFAILIASQSKTPVAWAHDGYSQWESNDGDGCCNNHDCKPVDDSQVRTTSKGYEILIAGKWCPVVPEKHYLRRGNAPDHASYHACIRRRYLMGVEDECYWLICFQPKTGF